MDDELVGKTTVKRVLTILRSIRDLPGVRGAQMLQIDWIIDTISSGMIYEQTAEYVQDDETRAFLEMEIGSTSRSMSAQEDLVVLKKKEDVFQSSNDAKVASGASFHSAFSSMPAKKNGVEGDSVDGKTSDDGEARVEDESVEPKNRLVGDGRGKSMLEASTSIAKGALSGKGRLKSRARTNSSGRSSPVGNSNFRRATRFVPNITPQRRAPLSTRAHAMAREKKTLKKSLRNQVSIVSFEHLDFFEKALQNSNFRKQIMMWSCDMHEIEKVSLGHPLQLVAATVFSVLNFDRMGIAKVGVFSAYMARIESEYRNSNPYHNRVHAADVTQTIAMFLCDPTVSALCEERDKFAAVIASAIHDVGHPGVNNSFHVNTSNELALIYNDISVLENMVSA